MFAPKRQLLYLVARHAAATVRLAIDKTPTTTRGRIRANDQLEGADNNGANSNLAAVAAVFVVDWSVGRPIAHLLQLQ